MGRSINLICGIFLVVGLGLAGTAVYAIRSTQSFVAKAEAVRGDVIDLEYRRDTSSLSSSGVYYPVVNFRTTTGEQHTFHSNTGSSPPSYSIGEAVTVLYDPTNPFDARISGFLSLWLFPLIFSVIGSLFSLGAAAG